MITLELYGSKTFVRNFHVATCIDIHSITTLNLSLTYTKKKKEVKYA